MAQTDSPTLPGAAVQNGSSLWAQSGTPGPLSPRRELLLEESTVNEQTISLWRLVVCLIVAVQSAARASFRTEAMNSTEWASLGCIFAAVVYSSAVFVAISRQRYATWLSYISVGMDVTLITATLVGMIATHQALAAVNNPLSVPLYLLALALAGLRYNPRVAVFATALTAAEYALVLIYAISVGDLYNLGSVEIQEQAAQYGQFDLLLQLTRILVMCCAGVIATFGVRRARELRTAAVIDALTQVYNRGFLEERFRNEFSRAARYQRELSVLILDVDFFKQYNDRRGHPAGDQVLREVADILRYSLRNTDMVARYGGEEFVCVLPEAPKTEATRLAERLRARIADHSFVYGQEQPNGALTVSIGVGTFPDDAGDIDALFQHADAALYRAKAAGRNRVEG